MAKRRPQRRRAKSTKFTVLNNDPTNTLGALADATVKIQESTLTLNQDFHCVSMEILASATNHTATEGPYMLGIAEATLTVTEIKEAIEAQPLSEFDIPAIEHAKRKVRLLGSFDGLATEEHFNDGDPIRAKLNWRVPSGKDLPLVFVVNRSSAPLTTGTLIKHQIKYFGYWK